MRNSVIVEKLIGYSNKLMQYCENMTYEQFAADTKTVEACVFNLSQMGELANKVDQDFARTNSKVPWRLLYGLRNRIVHDYEGVNLQLIWEIISGDIPELLQALHQIKL